MPASHEKNIAPISTGEEKSKTTSSFGQGILIGGPADIRMGYGDGRPKTCGGLKGGSASGCGSAQVVKVRA